MPVYARFDTHTREKGVLRVSDLEVFDILTLNKAPLLVYLYGRIQFPACQRCVLQPVARLYLLEVTDTFHRVNS